MNHISKTTLSYDETEDRLRLATEDTTGQASELWLTQRLANRLVTALTQWLDVASRSAYPAAQHMQSWEQSAAQALHRPSAPVRIDAATQRGLLTSIDLAHTDDAYSLVFRWPDAQAASLTLNATELRQWLNIMHGLYLKAEWPCQMWPAWFEQPAPAQHALSLH